MLKEANLFAQSDLKRIDWIHNLFYRVFQKSRPPQIKKKTEVFYIFMKH